LLVDLGAAMLPEGAPDCGAALGLSDPFAGAEPMLFVLVCAIAKTGETPTASPSKTTYKHDQSRREA
jgi:hypothetical protein